jgi:hypothetical protein
MLATTFRQLRPGYLLYQQHESMLPRDRAPLHSTL